MSSLQNLPRVAYCRLEANNLAIVACIIVVLQPQNWISAVNYRGHHSFYKITYNTFFPLACIPTGTPAKLSSV